MIRPRGASSRKVATSHEVPSLVGLARRRLTTELGGLIGT